MIDGVLNWNWKPFKFNVIHLSDQKEKEHCLEKAEAAFKKSLELCTAARSSVSDKDFHEMKARSLLNMGMISLLIWWRRLLR